MLKAIRWVLAPIAVIFTTLATVIPLAFVGTLFLAKIVLWVLALGLLALCLYALIVQLWFVTVPVLFLVLVVWLFRKPGKSKNINQLEDAQDQLPDKQ